jgi:hypothetical protein
LVTLAGYLAACAIFIVVRDWWFVWALLAILLVVATAVALHAQVRSQLVVPGASLALRILLIGLFLGVGAAMLLAWSIADQTDGWGFFGIATSFMGLGLLIGQGRRSDAFCRIAGPLMLFVSAAAIILGLIGIAPNSGTWAKVLLVGGIAIAPAGLSFTSAVVNSNLSGAPNVPTPGPSVLATKNTLSRRLCYVGLALFGGTIVAIVVLGVGWRWVALWGLVLFVMVVTTTARSNGDTAMLIAGAAVVWTLAQQGVPLPKRLQPSDGDTVMVAMGDSFMSGEGAPTYFKGTNTKGKNQCRRATRRARHRRPLPRSHRGQEV